MWGTYEAVFENGTVKLKERPTGVGQSRVLVTFLAEEPRPAGNDMMAALVKLRTMLADVRAGLADQLVAERRAEASRE